MAAETHTKGEDMATGNTSNSGKSAVPEAHEHFDKGNEFIKEADWDKAIEEFSKAIRLLPDCARIYNARGFAYHKKGDLDNAISDYTRAIDLEPAKTYYNNRGSAYHDKGNLDNAIGDYTHAIDLDPEFAFSRFNRAWAYQDKGDTDNAISDLTLAIFIDPKDADFYLKRGNIYFGIGNLDDSISDYTRAIDLLYPNYATAFYNRAKAFEKKGDMARASADLAEARMLGRCGDENELKARLDTFGRTCD